MKAFLIAAPTSGSGKTLITAAILEALQDKFDIAAFKIGPDYIDPMFHKAILNTPSINVDPVLVGEKNARFLYANRLDGKDLAVVEGVMGLFDGQSTTGEGSSAHVARLLGIPVVLVVDASGMGESVAALIKGFCEYDSDLNFAGIILNGISEKRYRELKKAVETACKVPVIGYFPRLKSVEMPSRHLGLVMPGELKDLKEKIREAAGVIKQTVNLERLLKEVKVPQEDNPFKDYKNRFSGLKVGVAMDEAFNFYYQDNLDVLKFLGCELVYFSPLRDREIPQVDLLYFGGGYPELYKEELSKNRIFIKSLKESLEAGQYALAECGGMMYLGKRIDKTPMVGFFDYETELTKGLKHFGYHRLTFRDFQFYVHEFHHSNYKTPPKGVFTLEKNGQLHTDGFKKKNVLAGYPHIHFYASPDGPAFLIELLEEIYDKS